MTVQIKLFATLKEKAGRNEIPVAITPPLTVQELLTQIEESYPALAPALPTAIVAVNKAFASLQTVIHGEEEIALFPPVSGGSDMPHPTYFAITPEAPDLNDIHARLVQPDVGAVVTFTGSVRGQTQRAGLPPQTLFLEYEAYGAMATAKMAQIAREIWERWPDVKGVAIVQRIGRLDVGDTTTYVACAGGTATRVYLPPPATASIGSKKLCPSGKKRLARTQASGSKEIMNRRKAIIKCLVQQALLERIIWTRIV